MNPVKETSVAPIILAGGSGNRLWPLSRSMYPKQLLPLVTNHTMLQETINRAKNISNVAPPTVICNQEHRFLVTEQLHTIGIQNTSIILEPIAKNTAPAVAIAALYYKEINPILLILPADHVIKDTQHFTNTINQAIPSAKAGHLVTFGVTPTRPETGYGYIKVSNKSIDDQAYTVEQFIEKPDLITAKEYISSAHYYWNSGIFMFRASRYLSELETYAPDILTACQKTMDNMTTDLNFIRLNKTLFFECPSSSIDYAVMEKTKNAVLVPLQTEWSDVGSWNALLDMHETDQHGNVIQGDVIIEDVMNSYIRSDSRMLAVVGVSDHVIIETSDAVLVAHKDDCQSIKNIVSRLKQDQRPEVEFHRKIHRPWGQYEVLNAGKSFQVKQITVKPFASLSLQLHYHRSEHWVVVSGTALVTRGEETFTITENQSTYIPKQVKHRLVNPGPHPLEIIEIQSGSYLGEDDIVRFEDNYGRILPLEMTS